MASTKVVFDEAAFTALVNENKYIRDALVHTAQAVAGQAAATANSAQNGTGGRLTGYAEAGFRVEYQARGGKRPRVNIISNADPETALAAHFYTQKRDGVGHLRAALYKLTTRG